MNRRDKKKGRIMNEIQRQTTEKTHKPKKGIYKRNKKTNWEDYEE